MWKKIYDRQNNLQKATTRGLRFCYWKTSCIVGDVFNSKVKDFSTRENIRSDHQLG